jgi:fructose-1,6-bisphosphatase/inositol monophosphatase family enzyme
MLQADLILLQQQLLDTVREVMQYIYENKFNFISTSKNSYAGVTDGDVFTDIDQGAQAIYQRFIQSQYPSFGIIGEENLCINPESEICVYVDPIDGTKAYIRMQSNGISTMFALVINGKIVAAYVGDINTGEIYGYGPADNKVWRYSRENHNPILLTCQTNTIPKELYIISTSCNYDSSGFNASQKEHELCRQFKGKLVQNSSIGVIMAQLWTGVVGAIILSPHYDTPWDSNPVVGISSALGYRSYKLGVGEDGMDELELLPDSVVTETTKIPYETLIINPILIQKLIGF